GTHMSMEDIGVLRSIPGMVIFEPADPVQLRAAMPVLNAYDGAVPEGMNHMNGKQALAFARERKAFVSGDNQRIKNQQAVFEAMIKKATSSKTMVLSYNKIISSLKDYFQMSVSSAEFRSLIKLQLGKNPDWKIYKNALVGDNGSERTYSTGNAYAYVMLQDQESIDNAKALINAVMNGDTLDKDEDGNVYVVNAEGESESTDE
ncbi:MAG: LCP family protein, partial [Mogibacterium sp.]|nr:LCP family protein [Mogibacterium sp.]